MTQLLKKRAGYPGKPFRTFAAKMWREFFKVVRTDTDLAHWVIEADSATVSLTPRCSYVDEKNPDWEPPIPTMVLVNDIIKLLGAAEFASREEVRYDFRQWAIDGILSAFKSKDVSKQFKRFNSESASFAIVVSPTDAGLAEDDLAVVWTNDDGLTVAKIRARQKEAHSLTRSRPVKKKRGIAKKRVKKKRAKK